MSRFLKPVAAILWKDLLLELRTRDIVVSLLVFSLLVVVVFNFALNPSPDIVKEVAPGILWVAFSFAGMLGLNRTFVIEKEQGTLEGLMLSPVGREAIFIGKLLAIFIFMTIMEVVTYLIFAMLFNLPLFPLPLVAVALTATLGFSIIGTIFSATAVFTRSREVMLPLLLFPVVIPVLIAAVNATGNVLAGKGWEGIVGGLRLLIVFDILFLVVASLTFEYVLEE